MKDARNAQQFIAGGHAALPQDSNGRPWTGDNVFSSGDLIEDLTHNFFLETVARQNKLRVYEMVEHPAAKALTGYLLAGAAYTRWLTRVRSRTSRAPT